MKRLEKMRAQQQESTAARQVADFEEATGAGPSPPAWFPRMLAVGLGLDSDPVRAGALMGLRLPPSVIEGMAAEARHHRDLIERKPGAIGALLLTAIAAGSVRLAANIEDVPMSQLPGALRAIAQSVELVQGSTTPAYSEIRLVVRAPDGSNWTTTHQPIN